jgi:hypothetical protein
MAAGDIGVVGIGDIGTIGTNDIGIKLLTFFNLPTS